jgi:WD40 repeat protein/serine/threonine protein kinase
MSGPEPDAVRTHPGRPHTPDSDPDGVRLGQLADEYLQRYRRGDRPALSEYTERHPDLAERIRQLFPALALMEDARPSAQTERFPGEGAPWRLGEYRILREIGRGGMGVVYEAEQESLGRRVALKVLPPGAVRSPRQVQRFEREVRAAARLHHTNIVPVFGVGAENGTHYYAMQYIEGRPLNDVLAELRRLRTASDDTAVPPKEEDPEGLPSTTRVAQSLVLGRFRIDEPDPSASTASERTGAPAEGEVAPSSARNWVPGARGTGSSAGLSDPQRPYVKSVAHVGVQVADALEYAAGQGVLHRDVKPSNLLLDVWGTVWLTDFGLAKAAGTPDLTHTGDLVGTLRYMAPERFRGHADVRSDIYALGLTLYELLALRPAFGAEDQAQLVQQITSGQCPRLEAVDPSLPRDLATIVHKAIARDPPHRYQTAAELAEDLRRYLDDRSILARRIGLPERSWRWCRRNPALAGALGGILVALLGGLAFSLHYAFGEKAARERADQREQEARTNETRAVTNENWARENEKQARQSAELARRQVEHLYVANGRKEEDDGKLFNALLWLARPLQGVHGPVVDEATHRLRLGCYFRFARKPALLQILDHQEPVARAAFSPDGRSIVTAGRGRTALTWDVATGEPLLTLPHQSSVLFAAFSPDGGTIATASADRTAKLWEASTGRLLFSLPHGDWVMQAEFSPDGRTLVTCGREQLLRVWDVASGKERCAARAHSNALVWSPLISPNGRWMLTIPNHKDAHVLVWDAQAPGDQAVANLQYRDDPDAVVTAAAFSPDSRRVVLANNQGAARVWELDESDGAVRATQKHVLKHASPSVSHASFSPDGRRIVTLDQGGTIRFWDAGTGAPTGPVLEHRSTVSHLTYGPDGRQILTATLDGWVRAWDALSGEQLIPPLSHHTHVTSASFSRDGSRVLTASNDGTARLWDLSAECAHTRILGAGLNGRGAVFGANGTRVVVLGDRDLTARVLDAATGRPVSPPVRHRGELVAAAISTDGDRVATSGSDGLLRVWTVATGADLFPPVRPPTLVVRFVFFTPDGRALITTDLDATIRIWDANTGRLRVPELKHAPRVNAALLSPDGRTLLTAGDDRTARLWDVATGKEVRSFGPHGSYVMAAAFTPDGRFLVTGGQSSAGGRFDLRGPFGEVHVWDVATGQLISSAAPEGMVESVAFSPDGRSVVAGCSGGLTRVWDAATGEPRSPVWRHGMRASSTVFSPDGHLVATAGADRSARVWDVATGQPVTPPLWHDHLVLGIEFSRDGRQLRTWSRDGLARLWDLVPDDRPAADIALHAQVLSGYRLDRFGVLERIPPPEQRRALDELKKKYPAEFSTTPEQLRAWHRYQAQRWFRTGSMDSAWFHRMNEDPLWPLLPPRPW